jgi:hypothetical protein
VTGQGPLTTAPFAERLRALVEDFGQVGETADVALAQAAQGARPCAFVMLAAERAGERKGGSVAYMQRNSATVGILIGVRVYGDETGEGAAPELADLTAKVRAALVGWKHPDAETLTEFVDGRVFAMDADATVWWLERYRADYWITT